MGGGRRLEKREKSDETGSLNDGKLPPRLPQTEDELDLAIKLLGNRKHCELGLTAQNKLKNLLGIYPTVKQASLWKRTLRRVYRELFENAEMRG